MNRYLIFSLAISATLSTVAIPLRAANKPRAGETEKITVLWTNQDLEKLRSFAPISIVGQPNTADDSPFGRPNKEADSPTGVAPLPHPQTDPEKYGKQAARLRDELERRQAQLSKYRRAFEDARSLKETTDGINLDEGDVGITPDAGIEILQQRVSETQSALDALEELARRNDIEPGTLRGQ